MIGNLLTSKLGSQGDATGNDMDNESIAGMVGDLLEEINSPTQSEVGKRVDHVQTMGTLVGIL